MMQRHIPVLVLLIVVAATSVFQIKFAVVQIESEISRVEQELEAENWQLRTLAADWAHLTRAERLAAHARALGMVPAALPRLVRAEQIGNYDRLQMARQVRPAELPSGQSLELRVKPVAAFDLESFGADGDMLGGGW